MKRYSIHMTKSVGSGPVERVKLINRVDVGTGDSRWWLVRFIDDHRGTNAKSRKHYLTMHESCIDA